ncbi:glycoside hydrolase family 32 protein [Bacillus sp. 03113]|uniref:glycoside hydrolase family 32 protein n=1 Tax=Bacillus sp. 03113 TaxID=2578211 RepID=UPI0015E87B2C|nr:glycoside hydrolase family 32 protein [Bacillus sp. 03113]
MNQYVKKLMIVLLLSMVVLPISGKALESDLYQETYRNQYHYSAKKNWLNDPNGLVYFDGVYHMFYQHNPEGNEWGNMSWGHATSTDLVHWEEQEVAIPQAENSPWVDFWFKTDADEKPVHYIGTPTTNWDGGHPNGKKYIFSGSIIVDKENVAGFGENALLAYYTSTYQVAVRDDDTSIDPLGNYLGLREIQEQCLAYSTDGGKTFTKYQGSTPVLPVTAVPNGQTGNFRDPKVVYDDQHKKWLMPLVAGQEVTIFSSTNLKDWTYESSIIREHDRGVGVWECPELIPMRVKGTDELKWVLSLSVQAGAPAGGSGMQYFVGDFDGKLFHPLTNDTLKNPKWLDFGEDLYAGMTFSNVPDRTIMLGWMSNWAYVGEQKTTPWKGEMTLPRELTLVKNGENDYKIIQKPVKEIDQISQGNIQLGDRKIKAIETEKTSQITNFQGTQYKVSANFSWKDDLTPDNVGFKLRQSEDGSKYISVGYNPKSQEAYIKRSTDGENINRDQTKVKLEGNPKNIKLTVYIDSSSIEVFVNDGEKTLTQIVYPNPENPSDTKNLSFFASNGEVQISNAIGSHLKSIWGN